MGYGQADLNKNYTGVGPMFFAIGEDVTSVQNLAVKGVAEAEGTGYTIAPITSTGNIPVKYFWWCGHTADGIPDGWYITDDADVIIAALDAGTLDEQLAPINMAKGEGLVTYMTKASLAVQGSGEVLADDATRPLNKNYTGVANPFPASVSVQDYAITGVAEAEGTGYTIAPITSTGNIPVKYFWWCGHTADGIPDGWYITDDADVIIAALEAGTLDEQLAVKTFVPGEAAVTYMTKAGLTLIITNPIN
ncbi:MAG: hypothetical protein IKC15_05695 [Kiritimatiellae bacterium]|nr:hypothetical protein [Kiritimatiellia bacterium]